VDGEFAKSGEVVFDADDSPNSHQNIIITFWTSYNVPWNLHANLFHGMSIESTN